MGKNVLRNGITWMEGLSVTESGDISRHGDGAGMLYDGGGMIDYDKELVRGVATSDYMAWCYW